MPLLRRRWFALLVAGEAINSIGSWASLIALWAFASYRYDAGAAQIAMLGLAWALPAALLGPVAGVPIDRFGPRKVLAAADLVGAGACLLLLFAASWHALVAVGLLTGLSKAFTLPAVDALPPRLVDDDELLGANALLGAASDSAIVFGPLVAAGAIAVWGVRGAFVIDAVTFLIGIAVVLPLPLRAVTAASTTNPGVLREAREGLRVAHRVDEVRWTLLLCCAVYVTWGTFLVVEPLYVRDVLHASATVLAMLQVAFGVGLVGAGLVLARLGDKVAGAGSLAAAVLLSGIAAALYVGTHSEFVAFLGVFLWGVDVAFFAAPSRTLLQRHAPPAAHGRVLALNRSLNSLGDVVALPLAGVVAAAIGPQGAAFAVALVAVSAGGVAFVRRPGALGRRATSPQTVTGAGGELRSAQPTGEDGLLPRPSGPGDGLAGAVP